MPPDGPICILGDSGCICHDGTREDAPKDYVLTYPECINYVATTPRHFQELQEFYQRNCK